jgi:hypothetical protein
MSARRPGAYCICNLLRLKTSRLGRSLKKTSSTQNNKLKVLSESDVDSVCYYSAEVLKLEQDPQVPAYLQRIVRCSNFRSDSSMALHHYRLYSRLGGTPRRQSQILFPESARIRDPRSLSPCQQLARHWHGGQLAERPHVTS